MLKIMGAEAHTPLVGMRNLYIIHHINIVTTCFRTTSVVLCHSGQCVDVSYMWPMVGIFT